MEGVCSHMNSDERLTDYCSTKFAYVATLKYAMVFACPMAVPQHQGNKKWVKSDFPMLLPQCWHCTSKTF